MVEINDGHGIRLQCTLPRHAYHWLELLAQKGFGTSAADVGSYLIKRALEDMMSRNVLPPRVPFPGNRKKDA